MDSNQIYELAFPILLALIIILGTIFYIFILFFIIMHTLNYLGGWKTLAKYYSAKEEIQGDRHTWQYISMNWVNYNGVMRVTLNNEGAGISLPLFFSWGGKPLFIPWNRLKFIEEKSFKTFKFLNRFGGGRVIFQSLDPDSNPINKISLPIEILKKYESKYITSSQKSVNDF